MPAIPLLLLSGALDNLDRRQAAKAQQAAEKRALDAEMFKYGEQKKIDAYYADLNAQADALRKQQEHLNNMMRVNNYAKSIEAQSPGIKTVVNPFNYEVREISMGENGFTSEQVDNIINPLNANYETSGLPFRYRKVPFEDNPTMFTWEEYNVSDIQETPEDFVNRLDALNTVLGTTNDDWEVSTGERGGFSATLKADADNPRTREEALALQQAMTPDLKPGQTTKLEETDALGWTVRIYEEGKDKDAVDTTKFSTKYAQNIPYGPLYFAMAGTGMDYDTVKKARPLVIDMTPDGSLPILGDTNNPAIQDDYVVGKHFKVFAPVTAEGSTMNVTDRMRQFFNTFRREDIETIVRNRSTGNQAGYDDLRAQLKTLSYAFTQETKLQTDEFIRLSDPVQAGVFKDEAMMLREIGDPGLIKAIDSGFNEAIAEANLNADLPSDTPASADPEGNRRVAKRPGISASSLVMRDENNTPYWNEEFKQTVVNATANGLVPEEQILDIVTLGTVPGSGQIGDPAGVVQAAASLDGLQRVFKSAYALPNKQSATFVEAPFARKGFGTLGTAEFRKHVAAFPTLEDRLLAIQSSIPKHVIQGFSGQGDIQRGSKQQAVYDLVAGGRAFKEIASEGENARKTLETGTQVIELLNVGARPGLLGELERAKASVNYLFSEAVDAVTGEVSPSIATNEDLMMEGPDGQPRRYTASSSIQADLNNRLEEIQGMQVFDEDSAQRQKDALLKFNLTVLSYAYAAMLDPNGRLSDADREAADRAIGNSLLSTPNSIRPVVNEIMSRANYMRVRAVAYTGGNAPAAFAMAIYDDNVDGVEVLSVTDVIRYHLPQRADVQGAQAAGGAGAARTDIASELSGNPLPTPQPAPAPAPVNPNPTPTPPVPAPEEAQNTTQFQMF